MDPEPVRRASLDEAVVTQTAFWKQIRKNIQKNGLLKKEDKKEIRRVCTFEDEGAIQRLNIAAALYIGINTKRKWVKKLLADFVLYDDCPLVALMLEKGCGPNSVVDKEAVIFNAKTVEMAELLRIHGANLNVTMPDGDTVLHNIFTQDKIAQLVPYYIGHGVGPLQQNSSGETALEQGITYHTDEDKARQNIIDRVAGFMKVGVVENAILAIGQRHTRYQPFVTLAIELYYKNKR